MAGDVGQIKIDETPLIVRMAEPVLLNPNSFQNLEKILYSTKRFANIPHQRKWVFLGCDDPPYIIASKLVERNPEKYDRIAMVPGNLHMNQQKTIFKILDIILEPLAKEVLNFESSKAYSFFVDAKDTHKTWQSLQVLLIGCSLELIQSCIPCSLSSHR